MSYSDGYVVNTCAPCAAARSLLGLGAIDRQSTTNSLVYVFSITAVRGLTTGSASSVPTEIVRKLNLYFSNGRSGWDTGGRVWGAFTVPYGVSMSEADRQAKVKSALDSAASAIGRNVSFDVAGYGIIPEGSSTAPTVSPGGPVTPPPQDAVADLSKDTSQRKSASMSWLPWVVGGTALAGIGAYSLYGRKNKKRVAANRRTR